MASKALVVGSGAIGLRTALELVRNNIKVVLYSAHHPLHSAVCSQGAGGLWMPYKCDDERVTEWGLETLSELLTLQKSYSKLIETVPVVSFQTSNSLPYPDNLLPAWTQDSRLKFQALSIEMLHWQNSLHQLRIPSLEELQEAGYLYSWLFYTPILDAPNYLMNMLELLSQNDQVEMKIQAPKLTSHLDMIKAAKENNCDAIVNCTGLASRELLDDTDLMEGRGILHYYDRNCARRYDFSDPSNGMINDVAMFATEPPWANDTLSCYLIPRGQYIAVGGAYMEGNATETITEKEHTWLQRNAWLLGIDTNNSKPVAEWVGFRPIRKQGICLELHNGILEEYDIKFVNNYGHGGSGWTVFVGCAKETLRLLQDA